MCNNDHCHQGVAEHQEQNTPPAAEELVIPLAAPVNPNMPATTDDCVVILDDVHSKLQPFIEQVMLLGKS